MSDDEKGEAPPVREIKVSSIQEAIEVAVRLHREGKLEPAEDVYRWVLAAEPRNADAMQFLGILLHGRGDYKAAAGMLRDALVEQPLHPGMWNNLGNVLLDSRDADGALEAYRRAAELAPDFAAPFNNLGILYRARGDHEEAEAAYRRALELEPRFVAAWHNLSRLLLGLGKFEESIECAMHALTFAPQEVALLHSIGIAHSALKQFDKAAEVYRTWIEKEPDNPVPRHLLSAVEGGEKVPARAGDDYVVKTFDSFAASFDAKLEQLGYQAPALVGQAVREACGADATGLRILDAGCGTGLCAAELKPLAGFLAGVDLSAGMLDQARRRESYDRLEKAELTEYLAACDGEYDVVSSADTLCYFGVLDGFAEAAMHALKPGGVLVFTVEAMPGEERGDYRLQVNGRYQHGGAYVDRVLAAAGFVETERQACELRAEMGKPVAGWLMTARKPLRA